MVHRHFHHVTLSVILALLVAGLGLTLAQGCSKDATPVGQVYEAVSGDDSFDTGDAPVDPNAGSEILGTDECDAEKDICGKGCAADATNVDIQNYCSQACADEHSTEDGLIQCLPDCTEGVGEQLQSYVSECMNDCLSEGCKSG